MQKALTQMSGSVKKWGEVGAKPTKWTIMQPTPKGTYVSTFEHSLDAKGRLTVPSEWRTQAHEKDLHIFPSSEGCLKVYPASWLAQQIERMAELPAGDTKRGKVEALASLANVATVDEKTGRIMVKEPMRKHAGIAKNATLVGSGQYFQIWQTEAYAAKSAEVINFEDAMSAAGL